MIMVKAAACKKSDDDPSMCPEKFDLEEDGNVSVFTKCGGVQ